MRTPLLTTIDDLAERLAYLHTYASEQGRPAPSDICFHPFSLTEQYEASAVRDELARLHDLGVTWCVLSAPPARDRSEYLDGARRFAADVMAPPS